MKGKKEFTTTEISELHRLITLRNNAASSAQKAIRQKIRNIGFYGKDDWEIMDLQISDLSSLINLGKIKVLKGKSELFLTPTKKPEKRFGGNVEANFNLTSLKPILESFKNNPFDPRVDSETKIHNAPGNYILCLRRGSKLPKAYTPIYTNFEGLEVIYTGIASVSLRTRDYRQHFIGNNAGRSTLRKSIGVLFDYKQIPRDKDPASNKTKFSPQDEEELSEWMCSNLVMFTLPTKEFNNLEIMLINYFNPPLNLKSNKSNINLEFRHLLSNLRTLKSINALR